MKYVVGVMLTLIGSLAFADGAEGVRGQVFHCHRGGYLRFNGSGNSAALTMGDKKLYADVKWIGHSGIMTIYVNSGAKTTRVAFEDGNIYFEDDTCTLEN